MRIAGSSHGPLKILLDHPETKDRVAAIKRDGAAGADQTVARQDRMDGCKAHLLRIPRLHMLRRYAYEQQTSQLAIWARRMALFSLAATVLAIIIVRSGLLEIRPAITTFAGAPALAMVALLLAFAAFIVI